MLFRSYRYDLVKSTIHWTRLDTAMPDDVIKATKCQSNLSKKFVTNYCPPIVLDFRKTEPLMVIDCQ